MNELKRQRMNVTISDEVLALVNEVHTLTGTPKAAVLSEILDMVVPAMQTQIHALRMMKDAPREAQRLLNGFAAESIGQLAQAQLDLDEAIDGRTVKGARARRRRNVRAT